VDPRRIGGHPLLPADLRLSQRPLDDRNDFDRSRRVADDFEWKTDRRNEFRQRHEDLDVARIPAELNVPVYGGGGRIHRSEGYLGEDAGDLLRAKGSRGPADGELQPYTGND